MKILITGGAGYIGSHAAFKACELGYDVVIIDNLFRGYQECVDTLSAHFPNKITFYKADLRDKKSLQEVFTKEKIDSVMHFAALLSVNESMQIPYLYFENNTYGTLNLLETLREFNVRNIVFSSTCATYAPPVHAAEKDFSIAEDNPQASDSVYGESKFLMEKEVIWFGKIYNINYTILRYFNVCGCNPDAIIGYSTRPSMALMQNAVRGALNIEPFKFTYSQMDTPDGSPIRDYVNVLDLVDTHFLALDKMMKENKSDIFNVGTGNGTSVKEVVDKVVEITGKKFDTAMGEARKGEATALYSNTDKITRELGWKPTRSIEDSINSLVKWFMARPDGWKE